MRIALKIVSMVLLIGIFVYMSSVVHDRKTLNEKIIRLHVVADSNSVADQEVKLKVRDAVLATLEGTVAEALDQEQAKLLLLQQLTQLQDAANAVLKAEGVADRATVTLLEEAFPTRYYDTFTLPSGVYDSLRITIGSGQGKNWWCVVFPSLCVPAAAPGVEDAAVSAGFSDSLTASLTGKTGYEVRFFVLDCLGQIQNFFHKA